MIARQAAQVLDLLEFFMQVKRPAKLTEISVALGWPRSSTFNVVTTLAQRGFLYEPRPRGGYYPSPKWSSLLHDIPETEVLSEELCNAVDEVAKTTGETVLIAAPLGTNAIFLHVVESTASIRMSMKVGDQVAIHATAVGRALLAQYSQRERASLLRKVKYHMYTPGSPMSAEQVEAELKHSLARGWHQNIIHGWREGDARSRRPSHRDHDTDHLGVALPVNLPDRRLSIAVGGPGNRMHDHIPQIAAALKRALKRHLPAVKASASTR